MFKAIENFIVPEITVLGQMTELTGSHGYDNDDGFGYDDCARYSVKCNIGQILPNIVFLIKHNILLRNEKFYSFI